MSEPHDGVTVLHVEHASRVAAITGDHGPRAMIDAGLLDAVGTAGGDTELVRVPEPRDTLGEVDASFVVAEQVAQRVRGALEAGRLPLVLSGSCHTAVGSVAGLPEGRRGVVWLDGHGDFNTPETTESGLLDGTTLATVTGRCWRSLAGAVPRFRPIPDESVLMVGVRDLDPGEARLLEDSSIVRLSADDVRSGAAPFLDELATGVDSVYVHLDLDVLDPSVGMANAFATPGGLSEDDLLGFLTLASARLPVRVAGLTSYDPAADRDGAVCRTAVRAAGVLAARGTAT